MYYQIFAIKQEISYELLNIDTDEKEGWTMHTRYVAVICHLTCRVICAIDQTMWIKAANIRKRKSRFVRIAWSEWYSTVSPTRIINPAPLQWTLSDFALVITASQLEFAVDCNLHDTLLIDKSHRLAKSKNRIIEMLTHCNYPYDINVYIYIYKNFFAMKTWIVFFNKEIIPYIFLIMLRNME